MSETTSKPYKMDSLPYTCEGDILYYAKWSDGSEYWVTPGDPAIRVYHGPLFGRGLNDAHIESFGHA